jgi:hypothetical protein
MEQSLGADERPGPFGGPRPPARPFVPDTAPRPEPAFDVGRAYWDQRQALAADRPRLEALMAAVDSPNELSPYQWAQLYATTLQFEPDLVIELGRAIGNSTAMFCQALHRLERGALLSLCLSDTWDTRTRPRIEPLVPPDWFDRLFAQRANILELDLRDVLSKVGRVLVFWDAHGFELAEWVLGRLLPALARKDHLVCLHDISDNRYSGASRSYGGYPLWKGSGWQEATRQWNSRVNLGWMNSCQDQVIALADFAARNDLELGSADDAYHRYFAAHPERASEMQALLGDAMFSRVGHWAFFSLNGRPGPFYFPGE